MGTPIALLPSRSIMTESIQVRNVGLAILSVLVQTSVGAGERPVLNSIVSQGDRVFVSATVPCGLRHVVLEAADAVNNTHREPLIAGGLSGDEAIVTFAVPLTQATRFLVLRGGTDATVPPSTLSGPAHYAVVNLLDMPLTQDERVLHVLNRVAYGPSPADTTLVQSIGVPAYLAQQLHPETIDEAGNQTLQQAEAALFTIGYPHLDTHLARGGQVWRYFKGTTEPPAGWQLVGFDDTAWLQGATGIGYGDDDDATVLNDMRRTATQPGYASVFLRRVFDAPDPATLSQLILRVDFDDGFAAYLNGAEVARKNLTGTPPSYNQLASPTHEAGDPEDFDITTHKGLLSKGANVLAFQVHNSELTSSDLSIIPSLINRELLPGDPVVRIKGIGELQQLVHTRGVLARRQLQAVLGELWENHFTTDFDKVADYLDGLHNSDGSDALSTAQARLEAAQIEYEEYQFFHDHALGYFGDLLLYSATSPSMLIYLDSVLNRKGNPNENYAREILELFAFGVDNRYTQRDIEELARCFTGWTIRKVKSDARPPFPSSARNPLTQESVEFEEEVLLDVGTFWRYFKGMAEPSPDQSGAPALDWALPSFDDSPWLTGETSIGYGDSDDTTVLADMRNGYASVYLRNTFTVSAEDDLDGLLLSVAYDDGFVAYLNGTEIARSQSMQDTGTPPSFNKLASRDHEVTEGVEVFPLEEFLSLIRRAPEANLLAIQVHNVELNSSDLSIHPRLIKRRPLPGSIENGDPNGVWVFRFNPEQHDTGSKTLFAGTQYQIDIPAGRSGVEGVRDAIDVIDAMASHPSPREFICLKLINRFVSDDINLISYRNGTAPDGLRRLLDDAMAAWMSTSPPGHVGTVLRAILRPETQDGYFWSKAAFAVKVKTPVEFINSSLRALNAQATSQTLPDASDLIGMHLFVRDDPDGWPEAGFKWMDAGSLLERIRFIQRLAGNPQSGMNWNVDALVNTLPDKTAAGIVDYFSKLLYGDRFLPAQRATLLRFANTDEQGNPVPLEPGRSDYQRRVRDLVALILAMPQWHNQ